MLPHHDIRTVDFGSNVFIFDDTISVSSFLSLMLLLFLLFLALSYLYDLFIFLSLTKYLYRKWSKSTLSSWEFYRLKIRVSIDGYWNFDKVLDAYPDKSSEPLFLDHNGLQFKQLTGLLVAFTKRSLVCLCPFFVFFFLVRNANTGTLMSVSLPLFWEW
jgi:hypothetical protein